MSAILKFDFQKRKQLRFSEVNYLNYTKKDTILHMTTTFCLKQGETRTSSGPIPHPLSSFSGSVIFRNQPVLFPIPIVLDLTCFRKCKISRGKMFEKSVRKLHR